MKTNIYRTVRKIIKNLPDDCCYHLLSSNCCYIPKHKINTYKTLRIWKKETNFKVGELVKEYKFRVTNWRKRLAIFEKMEGKI